MAASKKSDVIVDAVKEEAAPAVKVDMAPNNTARPNDIAIRKPAPEHTNSTFAGRAKAAGNNKRVDASDSEGK